MNFFQLSGSENRDNGVLTRESEPNEKSHSLIPDFGQILNKKFWEISEIFVKFCKFWRFLKIFWKYFEDFWRIFENPRSLETRILKFSSSSDINFQDPAASDNFYDVMMDFTRVWWILRRYDEIFTTVWWILRGYDEIFSLSSGKI